MNLQVLYAWHLLRIALRPNLQIRTSSRYSYLPYLKRLEVQNRVAIRVLGDGVSELRIHYGPGIRIYYAKIGNRVVLLLCGGDKGSQSKDIDTAKRYLKEYRSQEENHDKR